MDDTEDDAGYPPNPSSSYYGSNHHSQRRFKLPVRNPHSAHGLPRSYYNDKNDRGEFDEEDADDDDDDEDNYPKRRKFHGSNGSEVEAEEDDDDDGNIVPRSVDAGEDDVDDDDDDYDDEEEDDEEGSGRYRRSDSNDDVGPRGKRPIERFEFVPRLKASPALPTAPAAAAKPSLGGARGSPIADWSEDSTFALLDAWGDRFLQLGRKSLRSEDWLEVAKQVSESSRAVRTEVQCRNRLDTLKKKYKKEKMRISESGGGTSKRVYFKKMEELMEGSPLRQQPGLVCGVDSGEYVFMNPNVYLNSANGLDEMRDSPGNSENFEEDGHDSDEVAPKRERLEGDGEGGRLSSLSSFRMLADSIQKFGEIYEKMENNKRLQMMELEKMRMEFHRDLELQKRQILEQAQAEIAKIRQGDDDDDMDASAENMSG